MAHDWPKPARRPDCTGERGCSVRVNPVGLLRSALQRIQRRKLVRRAITFRQLISRKASDLVVAFPARMPASCKVILAPVISLDEDVAALNAASEIAEKFNARPIALILAVHLSSSYVDQEAPLSEVLKDMAGGASSHRAQLRRGLETWLTRASHPFEVLELAVELAIDDDKIAAHARLADLTVMARAASHDRARRALIESILFKSGRPLLVVPDRPLLKRSWDKIVIGWNARPEAVRAIVGAMPLLFGAKRVVITIVDAKPADGASGQDLAAYLEAHGIEAEVHNVDALGRTEARALLDDAVAIDADVLVLGAYGHSRAREILFGGVTREMIACSPVPILMAH